MTIYLYTYIYLNSTRFMTVRFTTKYSRT